MSRRIWTLTGYLSRRLLRSVSGILYILSAFALWLIFFNPQGGRVPESDYFVLVIGLYGAAVAFLVTLSLAARANQVESAAMIVRLPSRVEYLTALLLSALLFVFVLQALLSLVIILQPGNAPWGPMLFNVPPLWIAVDVVAVVLALHATDFVMAGWSRVYIFGILCILLFSNSLDGRGARWIGDRLNGIAGWASRRQLLPLADMLRSAASWVIGSGIEFVSDTIGLVFWPFNAIASAVQIGFFDNVRAFAPGILLIYATILFLLAADLFANKDLHLVE